MLEDSRLKPTSKALARAAINQTGYFAIAVKLFFVTLSPLIGKSSAATSGVGFVASNPQLIAFQMRPDLMSGYWKEMPLSSEQKSF